METKGMVNAFVLDGQGGGTPLDLAGVRAWTPANGVLWIHFDLEHPGTKLWLEEESELEDIYVENLVAIETRPRSSIMKDSILLTLRGVNLNPNANPEDMVAIRVYADEHRVFTTRKRKLLSIRDIVDHIENGVGPCNTAQFICSLTDRLTVRMEHCIEQIEEDVSSLENDVLSGARPTLRTRMSAIRRETIVLRRYLSPQREAMIRLFTDPIKWVSDAERIRLRETTDRLIRYIEDLDALRERTTVTHEELVNQLSEQMNSRMYILSIMAAIFLPLGFLTGLLGINVPGIPGSENKQAFIVFVVILCSITFGQIIIFKRKKWL